MVECLAKFPQERVESPGKIEQKNVDASARILAQIIAALDFWSFAQSQL